jgi:UDPglucose 6-dehydrogenase
MNIAMIGAGYVGLTSGACLAQFGHSVTCIDVDAQRIEQLRTGWLPIYEPGLAELIGTLTTAGGLHFSASPDTPVSEADMVFLAVGTPSLPDGDTDLQYILKAVDRVAPLMRPDAVLVIKSTVPAGTAATVRQRASGARGGNGISVASNPEFLREGSALADFMSPDRIVIGVNDSRAETMLRRLYEPLTAEAPLQVTSTTNAELIKYAANAFLALKIGFINDIADLCEAADGDVRDVAEGIGLDKRIGRAFLKAGPGFGGSCFPKDTRSLAATGRQFGAPQPLVEQLIDRNERRKQDLAGRVMKELGSSQGRVVAVLGTAFKAETDDVRESAALTVLQALSDAGMDLRVHDPKARLTTLALLPNLQWFDCPYAAASGADAVVVMTEWSEYRMLDLHRLAAEMAGDIVIDYRNLLDDRAVDESGLRLVALGRRPFRRPTRSKSTGGAAVMAELAASPL